jgi:hypothetical protein
VLAVALERLDHELSHGIRDGLVSLEPGAGRLLHGGTLERDGHVVQREAAPFEREVRLGHEDAPSREPVDGLAAGDLDALDVLDEHAQDHEVGLDALREPLEDEQLLVGARARDGVVEHLGVQGLAHALAEARGIVHAVAGGERVAEEEDATPVTPLRSEVDVGAEALRVGPHEEPTQLAGDPRPQVRHEAVADVRIVPQQHPVRGLREEEHASAALSAASGPGPGPRRRWRTRARRA